MTVRFKAVVGTFGPSGSKWTAEVAPGHTITKEKFGWSGGSNRVMCEFTCTCGWKSATASGVKNTVAEVHAREIQAASVTS